MGQAEGFLEEGMTRDGLEGWGETERMAASGEGTVLGIFAGAYQRWGLRSGPGDWTQETGQ